MSTGQHDDSTHEGPADERGLTALPSGLRYTDAVNHAADALMPAQRLRPDFARHLTQTIDRALAARRLRAPG